MKHFYLVYSTINSHVTYKYLLNLYLQVTTNIYNSCKSINVKILVFVFFFRLRKSNVKNVKTNVLFKHLRLELFQFQLNLFI